MNLHRELKLRVLQKKKTNRNKRAPGSLFWLENQVRKKTFCLHTVCIYYWLLIHGLTLHSLFTKDAPGYQTVCNLLEGCFIVASVMH